MFQLHPLESRVLLSVDLMADVNPGSAGSSPVLLIDSGGKAYFTANDGTHGNELFVTDGNSVSLVKDINPSGDDTYLVLYNANGTLFMNGNDGTHGGELWKTDGTPGGTQMIADINPGSGSGNPGAFVSFNNKYYFQANDGVHGKELWVTDGTTAHMVADINPGAGDSTPQSFIVFNNKLYFAANDGSTGLELHSMDTSENVTLVKDIYTAGINNFGPSNLTIFNGFIYFQGIDNSTDGFELWRTDGTPGGTTMVKNIAATGSSMPTNFCVYNGYLYFSAGGGAGGADVELWRTDGTDVGTTEIKDINPGTSNSSSPSNLMVLNNILYFVATDGTHGRELWRSDGTGLGTFMVKEIRPFSFDANINWLTTFNNALYFSADDGSNGAELWRSDGTAGGTVMVRNINATTSGAASSPTALRAANGSLYFFANDGIHGNELWKLTPPSAATTGFNVNTPAVTVTFNEPGAVNVTPTTYSIQNVLGGPTFSPTNVSYNATTHTAAFSLPANLANGNYQLTIPQTAATDAYGNWLSANYSASFFVLSGDADHSGVVDTTDFMMMAQNFGATGATFGQGDFNFDGVVNALDFNALATNFGTHLPAPPVSGPALFADSKIDPADDISSNSLVSILN